MVAVSSTISLSVAIAVSVLLVQKLVRIQPTALGRMMASHVWRARPGPAAMIPPVIATVPFPFPAVVIFAGPACALGAACRTW